MSGWARTGLGWLLAVGAVSGAGCALGFVAGATVAAGCLAAAVHDGVPAVHRVQALLLPDGYRLIVGRNLSELEQVQRLIGRALVWTALLTLVLGCTCGFMLSRRVVARLERVNRSSRAILAGDLGRRVPLAGSGDEFDELARNLNRMLDRIEELMRGMREVTENVAHDLRKPISRLRNRVEVTLMQPRDVETYRDALAGVIRETDEILAVFQSLLTIATVEAGTPRGRFESVDLARLLEAAMEIYGPAAEEAGLTSRTSIEDRPHVRGDPHLLTQVVANLLDNAIRHAPGSGRSVAWRYVLRRHARPPRQVRPGRSVSRSSVRRATAAGRGAPRPRGRGRAPLPYPGIVGR